MEEKTVKLSEKVTFFGDRLSAEAYPRLLTHKAFTVPKNGASAFIKWAKAFAKLQASYCKKKTYLVAHFSKVVTEFLNKTQERVVSQRWNADVCRIDTQSQKLFHKSEEHQVHSFYEQPGIQAKGLIERRFGACCNNSALAPGHRRD